MKLLPAMGAGMFMIFKWILKIILSVLQLLLGLAKAVMLLFGLAVSFFPVFVRAAKP